MKPFYPFVAVVLLPATLRAQPAYRTVDAGKNLRTVFDSVVSAALPGAARKAITGDAAKTTGTSSRMISRATFYYEDGTAAYEPHDSTLYTWSSGRGGDLDGGLDLADYATSYYHDGAMWKINYRSATTFNGIHQPLVNAMQSYSTGSGMYATYNQRLYEYDVQGRETSYIFQELVSGVMQNKDRHLTVYEADGSTTATVQNWNTGTSAWENSERTLTTESGSSGTVLAQTWNTGTASWENAQRVLYTRDAAGGFTEIIRQGWISGAWKNFKKTALNSNSSGALTLFSGADWDSATETWVIKQRTTITYDPTTGKITQQLYEGWNASSSSLVVTGRITTTYTSATTADELGESWDAATATWKNNRRTAITYDGAGNALTYAVQDWVPATSTWLNWYRQTYTYNSSNQRTSFQTEEWDAATSTWKGDDGNELSRYHYETYTAIPQTPGGAQAGTLHLYPLPANSWLHVEVSWLNPQTAEARLFDAAGRQAGHWTVGSTGLLEIPTGSLPSGTYFLQIAGRQGSVSQAVSVVH